jgi:hypothetical protein
MKLDLAKLTDAVTKVASLAQAHADISAKHDALLADHQANQDAIDTLTASLIAATTSPVEAVGLAAVAAAVAPGAPARPIYEAKPTVSAELPKIQGKGEAPPVTSDSIAEALAQAAANAPK